LQKPLSKGSASAIVSCSAIVEGQGESEEYVPSSLPV
jgi:hypothetical protein